MQRRDFVGLTGLAAGALFLPGFPSLGGTPVDPARLLEPGLDPAAKKRLADAALNAAKAAGATYADVRIGRYLNQSIFTREKQVQNIASGESFGAGVRVLAGGTWGFAATNNVSEAGLAKAAQQAVQMARANGKVQKNQLRERFRGLYAYTSPNTVHESRPQANAPGECARGVSEQR